MTIALWIAVGVLVLVIIALLIMLTMAVNFAGGLLNAFTEPFGVRILKNKKDKR